MKHFFHIITAVAATLILSSCPAKYTQPVSFEVNIQDLRSSKALISVKPSTYDAYYMCGIVNEDMEYYFNMTPEELARFQLDFSFEMWDNGEEIPSNISFTDVYCYRGNFESKYTYLYPDMDYKFIAFQVNPDTREVIGTPASKVFHTKPLERSDITFTFSFDTDKLTVTPSNNDPYYWDYVLTDLLDDEYADAHLFFYYLVDLYEDYGFMDMPENIAKGVNEWVFSRDDSEELLEGQRYTIVASGYNYGEINSDLTVAEFIYHSDKPCELVIPEEEED